MTMPIHEKIQKQLRQRRQRKKDLAAFLGIAPQTMTDICKGRSAVTLSHLRRLVDYFDLRADFWLDDSREEPALLDDSSLFSREDLALLEQVLLDPSQTAAARQLLQSIRSRAARWEARCGRSPLGLIRLLQAAAAGEADREDEAQA